MISCMMQPSCNQHGVMSRFPPIVHISRRQPPCISLPAAMTRIAFGIDDSQGDYSRALQPFVAVDILSHLPPAQDVTSTLRVRVHACRSASTGEASTSTVPVLYCSRGYELLLVLVRAGGLVFYPCWYEVPYSFPI